MIATKAKLLRQNWSHQHSLLLAAVLVAGFIAYLWDQQSRPEPDARVPEPIESAATYIPEGFVLVPIEVANFESLDSILGKFGVVDLFIPSGDPKKRPFKVAERIKILRAPLKPSHFAVLAPEDQSPKLVAHDGPFIVVVQNPSGTGTKFVNGPSEARKNDGRKRSGSRVQVEVTNAEEG